jgi:hypothetical protein
LGNQIAEIRLRQPKTWLPQLDCSLCVNAPQNGCRQSPKIAAI